ncbi:MAG TPA: glycoside hydrolase family 9 protein [Candidatus Obscuribacterales bacterium]
MNSAIALFTALTQWWGTWLGTTAQPLPPLVEAQWQAHAVESPLLAHLTQGRSLLVAAQPRPGAPQGVPTVTRVYPVQANLLAVEIETGRVVYGRQLPYQPQPGDRVDEDGRVQRQSRPLGRLVGAEQTLVYTFDQYQGRDLPARWLDEPDHYQLAHLSGTEATQGRSPQRVFRKSKPIDLAATADGKQRWVMHHTIYLQLPTALTVGDRYELSFAGQDLPPVTFEYAPRSQPSEAVHVSHIGFRPTDPVKVGFLSTWLGSGGGLDYPEGLEFWLVNAQTDAVAYTGKTRLAVPQDTPEDPYRNYNATDVYALDFAEFDQPGIYRLCVETVGCSVDFPLQEDVWRSPFVTAMRGLYHQRSGIALTAPYTRYERPRAFHPDDGVVVYQSTAKLMDTTMGIGQQNAFEALRAGRTDTVVPDAWGGYFDAGDWDRRIQHLGVAQGLLDLVELRPEPLGAIALNIPESGNALPDILDEALWGIDFYQRLQQADGGVPGGIESAEHPREGETSWQESLPVMVYAPDLWSSYWYASAAAQAAIVVQPWDGDRAAAYAASARRAYDYAEREYADAPEADWPQAVRDRRNLAALELWRLTGEESFHQTFLATTVFTDADKALIDPGYDQGRAAFLYARLTQADIDPTVQANARRALLDQADRVVEQTEQTAFQWAKHHPHAPVGWGTSWSSPYAATTLVQAHWLTDDERYAAALIRTSQAPLGANPENRVYTTGLGQRSPQNPLIPDQRIRGIAPPPGITVYGPIDITHEVYQDYWFAQFQMRDQMYPEPTAWPITELFVDVHINVAMTEFTVQQTIGPAAYVWGYLAAMAAR